MPSVKRSQHDKTALLIVDMLSEFEFPDGKLLQRAALRIARPLSKLRKRARSASIPVIYVNDTAGKWESDQRAFIERCLDGRGAQIAQLLRPDADDYFMFKPRHSAFYGTPLAELLYMLKIQRIVLTGISSHQCVLLTASDAHVRGIKVVVARDCIAAAHASETRHASFILERALEARLQPSSRVRF